MPIQLEEALGTWGPNVVGLYEGELHEGTVSERDTVPPSPCLLATERSHAAWYAVRLVGEDTARRVVTYATRRPVNVLMLADGGPDLASVLSSLGVTERTPVRIALSLAKNGFDGVMIDGGSCGWHVALNDSDLLEQVSSEHLQIASPLTR